MATLRKDRSTALAAGWPTSAAMLLIALLISSPAIAVLASVFEPYGETIRHVVATLGVRYFTGTLTLTFSVGVAAGLIGVAAALLVALCDFPLRRALSFGLVLPIAIPAYIAAYAYADLLGPFGGVTEIWRALVPFDSPSIRNLPGAAFILALTLYPYCYLSARAAFASRSAAVMEAARTLGAGSFRTAAEILIPVARPAIAGGVALVMMETAAEFGVADYFGVSTLSVGIFRTWYSFGDLTAASQLASGLFLFSAALIGFEYLGRRGRHADAPRVQRAFLRHRLKGTGAALAVVVCAAPIILGFLLPVVAIVAKSSGSLWSISSSGLFAAFQNSMSVGAVGAAITLAISILLSYRARHSQGGASKALIRLATLGYAIPGAVIAIGVLAAFAGLKAAAGITITGIAALLFGYVARFLGAGYAITDGALSGIDTRTDDAAKSLGASRGRILAAVHLPLMRRSLIAASTILFVDIVKELPATLILRDFNFETLATRVYRLAGDERFAEAAPNALVLIAISAIPIFVLNRITEQVGGDQRSASSTRSQI